MEPIQRTIRNYALQNALRYGKPDPKAVMGKVLARDKELRQRPKEVLALVRKVCDDITGLSRAGMEEELKTYAPELLERKQKRRPAGLPDLPNVKGKVVMRFAPGPSGPLHI
ncbi:MAG: glutamate--tRNA ligase, partial [Thermoplasmata archaeon]|nr:glutamate--tRNA ligase [Thermoplasmata archaeon]